MIRFEKDGVLWAAESAGATPKSAGATPEPTPAKRKAAGAFDRRVAAELQEAEEVAHSAQDARFAPMLEQDYEVTPASVSALLAYVADARADFGIASSQSDAGQADTQVKDDAEAALVAALRRVQTGARLTYPDSASNQARYFIGTNLDNAEDQLVQIATTVLRSLTVAPVDVLRSVKAAQISALSTALTAWQSALQTQSGTKSGSVINRTAGNAALEQIAPLVRAIKIAADGEFPYTKPENRPLRTLFHIPELRPYTYTPRDA